MRSSAPPTCRSAVVSGRPRTLRISTALRHFPFASHLLQQRALLGAILHRLLCQRAESRIASQMRIQRIELGQVPPTIVLSHSLCDCQFRERALVVSQDRECGSALATEPVFHPADRLSLELYQDRGSQFATALRLTSKHERMRIDESAAEAQESRLCLGR